MKKNLIVLIIFIVLTLLATYPLIIGITNTMPGFSSTDEPFGVLWYIWLLTFLRLHHVGLTSINLVGYPIGVNLLSSGLFAVIPNLTHYLFSFFADYILNYNIQLLINFILTGFITYLLLLFFTGDILASLISGIIFAFSPQFFVRTWQHPGMSTFQWIPLLLLCVFRLKENLSSKNMLYFALALFIVSSADFHIFFFSCSALAAFLVFTAISEVKNFKQTFKFFKAIAFAGALAFLLIIPQYYFYLIKIFGGHSHVASAYNLYKRPFEDLFEQSAKPLSYFLPAAVHPVFGKFTEQFVGSPLYGDSLTEHTLYLGWVPLALVFVAVRRWRRERREAKKLGTVPFGDSPYYKENFYIGFFIFLGVVAWLFSQPPWWQIGPIKIFMPSFFRYKILPMFRAYCRFGIVVMLAVAVLAGFGLKFILERFKSNKTKIAVTMLACALVLFEFWNWPPYKVIDVSKVPTVYYWLKDQPGDIVIAEYPLDIIGPNEMYKFYQTKHEKRIINGTVPGTHANNVAKTITKLSKPETAGILKWMGVKYVLVHRDGYLQTELIEDKEELDKIPQNKALKFIRSFPAQECPDEGIMCVQKTGPIDVYEVVALPIKPNVNE